MVFFGDVWADTPKTVQTINAGSKSFFITVIFLTLKYEENKCFLKNKKGFNAQLAIYKRKGYFFGLFLKTASLATWP